MAKETTYYANWTLEYNGKTYERGAVVEISDADAKPLLGGVLSTSEPSDSPAPTLADELAVRVAELEQEVTTLKADKAKLEQEVTTLKAKPK